MPGRKLFGRVCGSLFLAAAAQLGAHGARGAVDLHVYTDHLVLDQGQPNPHDVTTFDVPRFNPALGDLQGVEFMLRSQWSGGVLFHGVHGEGYFHYTPYNYVEGEVFDVANPPALIVDNLQPMLTCHAYSGGGFDVSCEMHTTGDMSVVVPVSGADVAEYEGAGTYAIQVAQQDRSGYTGNFPPDPGGPTYTGRTYLESMSSDITLEVRYTYEPVSGVPERVALPGLLRAPLPNPASDGARLEFELPRAASTRLSIHDASGREIRTLLAEVIPAGPHARVWDGRDAAGDPVPAGVYFVRLSSGGIGSTTRLALVR